MGNLTLHVGIFVAARNVRDKVTAILERDGIDALDGRGFKGRSGKPKVHGSHMRTATGPLHDPCMNFTSNALLS